MGQSLHTIPKPLLLLKARINNGDYHKRFVAIELHEVPENVFNCLGSRSDINWKRIAEKTEPKKADWHRDDVCSCFLGQPHLPISKLLQLLKQLASFSVCYRVVLLHSVIVFDGDYHHHRIGL